MTVVLIVRVAAWENVHTGMNRGSVPGRGNGRKLSQEPKDREDYKRILLYDLNFLLWAKGMWTFPLSSSNSRLLIGPLNEIKLI